MTRALTILGGAALVALLLDCGLNPQPLPPDAPMDGGGVTVAVPGVGDSGHSASYDAGMKGGVGGNPDGGAGGGEPDTGSQAENDAGFDSGGVTTPNDAGGPVGDGATDASIDSALDGAAGDGGAGDSSATDAPVGDGAPGADGAL